MGPFFVLTILVLIGNRLLTAVSPKLALSAAELVTIWCIMAAASGIPSTGMMRYALGPMVAYQYFATAENDWTALFHQHIPHWRVVRDNSAIKSFYEGISSAESIPWAALRLLGQSIGLRSQPGVFRCRWARNEWSR